MCVHCQKKVEKYLIANRDNKNINSNNVFQ